MQGSPLDTLQTGERYQVREHLNEMFAPEWEMRRVASTIDDPYLAGVEGEQYSDADKIIKNMLDRGVLTSGGYDPQQKDLENQRAGVRSDSMRSVQDLSPKNSRIFVTLATVLNNQPVVSRWVKSFDPYSYQGEADTDFNEFISTLGDQIRAAVPGQLFNTAGLAAIGGAGQGLGNTAFNPAASGGIQEEDPNAADEEDKNANSIF